MGTLEHKIENKKAQLLNSKIFIFIKVSELYNSET